MTTKIVSQKIDFEPPEDREFVISLAQVPVRLKLPKPSDSIYKHENPSKQWKLVKEILTKVKDVTFEREHTVDILLFPELSIPFSDENRDYILDYVKKEIEPPFIGIFPFDNIDLEKFRFLLKKSDNDKAEEYANEIRDTEDFQNNGKDIPVNFCSVVIKAKKGKFQEFIQAKNAPSTYESLSHHIHQVYNYKYLHWFNSNNIDFIILICSDFIKKMPQLKETTLSEMSKEEKEKWFREKKKLDFLFIPQLNPRPNDVLFRCAKRVFYIYPENESLSKDAYVISLNASLGSSSSSLSKSSDFGNSSIIFNKKAKFSHTTEYSLQTFDYDTDYPNLKEFKLTNPLPRLYFLRMILSRDYNYDPSAFPSPIIATPIIKSVEDEGDNWIMSKIELREAIPWIEITKKEIDLFRGQYTMHLRLLKRYCPKELLEKVKNGSIRKEDIIRYLREEDPITYFHKLYVGTTLLLTSKNINNDIVKSIENLEKRLEEMEKIINEQMKSRGHDLNLILSYIHKEKDKLKDMKGIIYNVR